MHLLIAPAIILVLFLVVDLYLLRLAILPRRKHRLTAAFCIIEAIPMISMTAMAAIGASSSGSPKQLYLISVLLTIAIVIAAPTIIYAIGDVLSRIPVIFHRRPWRPLRIAGGILASAALILCICGIFNRKRITVERTELSFKSLPQSLDGYRIVHISDLHLGSFGSDTLYISTLADRINSLKPDLILFTGDIVSRHPDEMIPFISSLGRLKARNGIFAVLGNHDYCDYVNYEDESMRVSDRKKLHDLYEFTPLKLLDDSTVTIVRGTDSIDLTGTGNIGLPPFHAYGSIDRASVGRKPGHFSILMTHDPSAWHPEEYDFDLTLSGHTHSMQMNFLGISPAPLHHERWEGIYREGDRILNINRGIGTVGPLIRIGATPQISLLILRSADNSAGNQPEQVARQ